MKKTLPKDFSELLKAGDIAALKAVFNDREVSAYDNGFNKKPALSHHKVPDELVRWLISRGADIEQRDHYGKTPLYHQAGSSHGNVELFLELGADIEAQEMFGTTPLYHACSSFQPQNVRILVAHGANMEASDELHKRTPLAETLALCRGGYIPKAAEIAEILLDAGAKITPEMADSVLAIGKDFEFRRESYNKDFLPETDAGLARLYELFGVEPVAKRRIHDGVSPIIVTATTWQKQYAELWDFLVPSQGAAMTAQGEAIRIAGRVSHEVLDNGGMNWDADFRKMLDALVRYLGMGAPLASAELTEAAGLAAKLRAGSGDKEPTRLTELTVQWVLKNPNPMPPGQTDYRR